MSLLLARIAARHRAGSSGDPYWANVSSLLHFAGADGSTSFIDQTGKTWTKTGSPVISTAQYKFPPSSLLLHGVVDVIGTPYSSAFDFGTGDFTIEAFIRPSITQNGTIFSKRISGASGWALSLRNTGAVWLRANIGGTYSDSQIATAASIVAISAWVHVALSRNGNTWRLFVGGVLVGTLTNTGALQDQAATFRIGSASDSGEDYFTGNIAEARVTKGVGRYAANFTPPAAPFANA